MSRSNRAMFAVCPLAVAMLAGSAAAQFQITLDPSEPDGARIKRMGWDLKGFANQANTEAKARRLYEETNANIIRIPIFAQVHNENGTLNTSAPQFNTYNTVFGSLFWIMTVKPDTEIFASIKLDGVDTFPEWVESDEDGQIFGNTVKKPDPDAYSTLLADYLRLLRGRGITSGLDYSPKWFGPNNETEGALTADRHIDTVRMLRQKVADLGLEPGFQNWQVVSPDAFGFNGGKSFANDLVALGGLDTLDIAGAHYYYSITADDAQDWIDLGNITGAPLWFTEVHMSDNFNQTSEPIPRARRSLGTLIDANRAGADTFIWWGTGSNANAITGTMMREIINSMNGYRPVVTGPAWPVKQAFLNARLQQAYREGNRISLWFANPRAGRQTPLDVQLNSGLIAGDVEAVFWSTTDETVDPGDTGTLVATVDADRGGFSIPLVPEDSMVLLTFELANGFPLFLDNYDTGSQLNSSLAARQGEGQFESAYTASDNGEGFTSAFLQDDALVIAASDVAANGTPSIANVALDADFEIAVAGSRWSVSFDATLDSSTAAGPRPGLTFAALVGDSSGLDVAGAPIALSIGHDGANTVSIDGSDASLTGLDPLQTFRVRLEIDETSSPALVTTYLDDSHVSVDQPVELDGLARHIEFVTEVADSEAGQNLLVSVDDLRISAIADVDVAAPIGEIDAFDLIDFVEQVETDQADLNGDGVSDGLDIEAFKEDFVPASNP